MKKNCALCRVRAQSSFYSAARFQAHQQGVWNVHLLQRAAPAQVAGHREGAGGGEQEGRAQQRDPFTHLQVQDRLFRENCLEGENTSTRFRLDTTSWSGAQLSHV